MAGFAFAQDLARVKQAKTLLKTQLKQQIGTRKSSISKLHSEIDILNAEFEDKCSALDEEEQTLYLSVLIPTPAAEPATAAGLSHEAPISQPRASACQQVAPAASMSPALHSRNSLPGLAETDSPSVGPDPGSCSMHDADHGDSSGYAAAPAIPIAAWPSAQPLVTPSAAGQHLAAPDQACPAPQHAMPSALLAFRALEHASPHVQADSQAPAIAAHPAATAGQALFHYTLPIIPAAARASFHMYFAAKFLSCSQPSATITRPHEVVQRGAIIIIGHQKCVLECDPSA